MFIGSAQKQVDASMSAARQAVESAGLPTHEVEVASLAAEILGRHFDGRSKQVLPKARRAWRVKQANSFYSSVWCDLMMLKK